MRILITGAAGFLGALIVRELLEHTEHDLVLVDDCRFRAFDRLFVPYDSSRVAWYAMPLVAYLHQFPDDPFEAVVHCAAHADISGNWGPDGHLSRALLLDDVVTTHALLERCVRRADEAERELPFVFLSTLAVYGDDEAANRGTPTRPGSPYAASKVACEAMVRAFVGTRMASPWWILRLASCVGPGYHHGHVADFARAVARGERVIPKSNPNVARSFVHALDVARIVRECLDHHSLDYHLIMPGIHDVSGGLWSVAQTMEVMGLPMLTSDEMRALPMRGWLGDPQVSASSVSLGSQRPRLSIADGVVQALKSLWKP